MIVEEYNQAVDLFSDAIFRFVLKNCRDEDKAKDIVQDTYEKLWKNHKNVNFLKVKSYLFSTAYHTLIDSIRRDKKRAVSVLIELQQTPIRLDIASISKLLITKESYE